MISPRFGAGVAFQRGSAISAALTAIATSAAVPCWKRPMTSRRSAGLRLSKVAPETLSTHSPAMNSWWVFGGAPVGASASWVMASGSSSARPRWPEERLVLLVHGDAVAIRIGHREGPPERAVERLGQDGHAIGPGLLEDGLGIRGPPPQLDRAGLRVRGGLAGTDRRQRHGG